MPIANTDLIAYGALNRPEDGTSLTGGAIDIDHRPEFTPLAANDQVEAVSDNAGDTTQNITVTGRDATGAIVSDTKTLNGTTPVVFTPTFERILKVVMSADAAGTVTIRRITAGPTLATIPAGERGFFRLFIDAASESGAVDRHEKLFWKNNHGTLALTNAEIDLTADPAGKIQFGLEGAKDDTNTVANRKTAPGGVTFFDDNNPQPVPGNTLEAGSAIGVWIKQSLLAADSPVKNTFTTQASGTSV